MARYNLPNVGKALKTVDLQRVKTYVIGIALLVLTGLIVYELLSKKGKAKHIKRDFDPDNLSIDPEAFANDIYNRISGYNFWTGPRADVLTRFNALNDDEFIAVYTAYNSSFKTPPESLRTDISGEWLWDSPFGDGILSQIEQRFNRLQLP